MLLFFAGKAAVQVFGHLVTRPRQKGKPMTQPSYYA
jgi:hypothetical protein